MKKILLLLSISFLTTAAFAQDGKSSPITGPVMTNEFADSLKSWIAKIIPKHYDMKLLYQSNLTVDGKLLKPLIVREEASGTIEDNDFVVKLKELIKVAPAWKPAVDNSSNTAVSSEARFFVMINNGTIKVMMDTKGKNSF